MDIPARRSPRPHWQRLNSGCACADVKIPPIRVQLSELYYRSEGGAVKYDGGLLGTDRVSEMYHQILRER